ncbi:uncharacterized protein LOC121238517 isoform X4 [Juglans microcarpa x Juglans regia]|uniref:uncharacterized protein LOC121238517 isoform X4 n=1 Tax=Juglans microcarpa x Juglans regia TaxID=2249226 RepID=UPI001B7E6802|nr:uncharacterized protein LOC121238517 isoform X4 [Juglans microcarpa x Juglans regia]
MSSQNIEKVRNSFGATITVLAQNQMPLCASAHESDRVVQISGDVPAVLKALEEIGSQLRCGSNISRVTNESGAMIKVYGGKGEQKHRQIQFGGFANSLQR